MNIALLARQHLGWTQKQLAQYLGVTIDCVRHWEHGRRKPNSCAQRILLQLSTFSVDKSVNDF